MEHKRAHATVELIDKGGKGVDFANSSVNVVAKSIAASEAFRKYDWLRKMPIKNSAKNMRGMVINAKARMVYDFTIEYGTKLEKFNTFVTVAVALADSAEETWDILQSKETWDIKTAKLGTQATAVAMNVLTGIVTAPAHALLLSMQGYCDMKDVLGGQAIGTCGSTLKALDSAIMTSAKQVSDGKIIYTFVNTTINPQVSKLLGL